MSPSSPQLPNPQQNPSSSALLAAPSSPDLRKEVGGGASSANIFLDNRTLLKDIFTYNQTFEAFNFMEEFKLLHEIQNDVEMEGNFWLCLNKLNHKNRVECLVKVYGQELTIFCNPRSQHNSKNDKESLKQRRASVYSKRASEAIYSPQINQSSGSKDLLTSDKLDEILVFDSEYTFLVTEQYYNLLEDRNECVFQFIDYKNSKIYLYPKTEEMIDKWATYFKRNCILTNLYDCFEIDELLFHSTHFNIYRCQPKVGEADYTLKIFHKKKCQANRNDVIKELYFLRLLQKEKSRYVATLHYVFETDASIVFVMEGMFTYSPLNLFIIFIKNSMYMKIFIMFCFIMFTKEAVDHNMLYTEVDRNDFYFQAQNEEYSIKCFNFINFKKLTDDTDDIVLRIKNYHALVSFLTYIFKVDQIYYEQENENVRTEIKLFLAGLSNVNYMEINQVLHQFHMLVEKHQIAMKIVKDFRDFSEQYKSHENYQKVADQHMKTTFSKQTSHLTTSIKTFENLGKTGQSKNSIPDLTQKINKVLDGNFDNKKVIMNALGMNRLYQKSDSKSKGTGTLGTGTFSSGEGGRKKTRLPRGKSAFKNRKTMTESQSSKGGRSARSRSRGPSRGDDSEDIHQYEEDMEPDDAHSDRVKEVSRKDKKSQYSRSSSMNDYTGRRESVVSKMERTITFDDNHEVSKMH